MLRGPYHLVNCDAVQYAHASYKRSNSLSKPVRYCRDETIEYCLRTITTRYKLHEATVTLDGFWCTLPRTVEDCNTIFCNRRAGGRATRWCLSFPRISVIPPDFIDDLIAARQQERGKLASEINREVFCKRRVLIYPMLIRRFGNEGFHRR